MYWENKRISLILPTYNEKDSIKDVIERFDALGVFSEIIVINNNAVDGTTAEVAQTNAIEIVETTQGYGAAILRGFVESKGDLIAVCEPDATFVEKDIFKLLAFADSFDVVYGSRTMNDMIWEGANMGWFLRVGNWAVAKLMQVLFNTTSLTDVGCTYRLIHRENMLEIVRKAKVTSNFFGPEMMLLSILSGFKVVQIPITYKKRVGESSVTGDKVKAFKLGIQMIKLIVTTRFSSFSPKTFLNKRKGVFADCIEN